MITSTRFNFSPLKSLSLSRFTARAKRSAKSTSSSAPILPAPVSFSFTSPAPQGSGVPWDHSILDHLQAPLTRFHD